MKEAAVEDRSVEWLTPHARNPRKITPARMEQLARNLAADPDMLQARPVIALPDGTVIAGNQRLLAARQLGWETTIPTVVVDLDADRARLWQIRDNETMGTWDEDGLGDLLAELAKTGVDLDLTGLEGVAVDRLLRDVAKRGRAADDDVPPLPAGDPRSKLGEVYELGPHRLMCGDALDAIKSGFFPPVGCVLADPPYGIGLDTDYRQMGTGGSRAMIRAKPKLYRPVEGDDRPFDAAPFSAAFRECAEQFWFGADYYRRTLSSRDLDGSYLVWDKRNAASDAGFGSGFELIWSRNRHKRDLLRHYFFGPFGSEASGRVHPTQKPSGLLAEILTRWAPEGCMVADPFAGSGTALIACAKTGRSCYAVEIDPGYCDVIRDRWEAYTNG